MPLSDATFCSSPLEALSFPSEVSRKCAMAELKLTPCRIQEFDPHVHRRLQTWRGPVHSRRLPAQRHDVRELLEASRLYNPGYYEQADVYSYEGGPRSLLTLLGWRQTRYTSDDLRKYPTRLHG